MGKTFRPPELTDDEHCLLLLAFDMATGVAQKRSLTLRDGLLRLINKIEAGNPNRIPYEVPPDQRKCQLAGCGKSFRAKTYHQKFCSNSCYQKNYRKSESFKRSRQPYLKEYRKTEAYKERRKAYMAKVRQTEAFKQKRREYANKARAKARNRKKT